MACWQSKRQQKRGSIHNYLIGTHLGRIFSASWAHLQRTLWIATLTSGLVQASRIILMATSPSPQTASTSRPKSTRKPTGTGPRTRNASGRNPHLQLVFGRGRASARTDRHPLCLRLLLWCHLQYCPRSLCYCSRSSENSNPTSGHLRVHHQKIGSVQR